MTRRVFIALAPAAAAAQESRKGQTLPPERLRYLDRSTEFPVTRLTSPEHETWMPASPGGGISRRSNAVLAASSRPGRPELLWVSLAAGESRILSSAEALDPHVLALTSDDRWVAYLDGVRLVALQRDNLREQVLARFGTDGTPPAGVAASADRLTFYFLESAGNGAKIKSVRLGPGPVQTVAEAEAPVAELAPNPRRALIAWRTQAGVIWAGGLDGSKPRSLECPEGRVLQFHWAHDGQSILYLLEPADTSKLIEIREQQVDSRADVLVAKTSQFACFAPNSNGSAFVGASRSKASPHILLLLRATKREFTLCEHGDPDPAASRPVFTPDSQSVVFSSPMHGKRAIYVAAVERLIEKTTD